MNIYEQFLLAAAFTTRQFAAICNKASMQTYLCVVFFGERITEQFNCAFIELKQVHLVNAFVESDQTFSFNAFCKDVSTNYSIGI